MKAECLDFQELPGQNPLFLDFLYDFERVQAFYSPAHLSPERLEERAEQVLKGKDRYPRELLVETLQEFHRAVDTGPRTFQHLKALSSPDALAVVTGQQVGLFGGPAYTVYKTATAIELARLLRSQGYNAVPVFWLAADDFDFDEVRSTCFVRPDTRLLTLNHPDTRQRSEQMAGTVPLQDLEAYFSLLRDSGPAWEFQGEVVERLQGAYRSGRTFREAFTRWLADLFQDEGLIFFDPLLPRYGSALGDFFLTAVDRRPQIVAALEKRKEDLSAGGYGTQVWFDESETLLFWSENGCRYKLEFRDGRIRGKNRRSLDFDPADFRRLVQESPERLSPSALLRPILQDYLFPTAIYVGGPAEVAYFSQVSAISPFWGMEMAIFPRAAFTLVDRKAQRLLQKYGLSVAELLRTPQGQITEKILREKEAPGVMAHFDRLKAELQQELDLLQRELQKEDPPVAEMLGTARRKIFYQVEKVQRRFVGNLQHRNVRLQGQLDYLENYLKPRGTLQERCLNFNQFLMQEGEGLLDRLFEHVHPFCRSHKLLYF